MARGRAAGAVAMDAAAPSVYLPRLLVLVRARRVSRLVARLALLALPGWFAVVIAVIETTDEYSSSHAWIDDHANRGFVVVLAVLAASFVVSAGARLAGPAGTTAARLVPMLRSVPDPVLGTVVGQTHRLLDAGSRSRRARASTIPWPATFGLRVGAIVLVVVIVIPASMIRAQYRASHGQGGPVVTVGENSRITRTVEGDDNDSYYLSSPRGEALVEGPRKPDAGSRYVIIETVNGRLAVHVGGYSWITSLVVCLVALLLGAMILYFSVRRFAARRPDERIVALSITLDDLARGRPVTVQPVAGRGRRKPPAAVALTAAAGGPAATADRVRRRVRVVTIAETVLFAAAGLVTAMV